MAGASPCTACGEDTLGEAWVNGRPYCRRGVRSCYMEARQALGLA